MADNWSGAYNCMIQMDGALGYEGVDRYFNI